MQQRNGGAGNGVWETPISEWWDSVPNGVSRFNGGSIQHLEIGSRFTKY